MKNLFFLKKVFSKMNWFQKKKSQLLEKHRRPENRSFLQINFCYKRMKENYSNI